MHIVECLSVRGRNLCSPRKIFDIQVQRWKLKGCVKLRVICEKGNHLRGVAPISHPHTPLLNPRCETSFSLPPRQ